MTDSYLYPTERAAVALMERGIAGPVVMLNLLRFREIADYAGSPARGPAAPITGEAAFDLYVEETLPLLRRSGGELLFMGAAEHWLIGPEAERWDRAMLVRQASVEAFLAFGGDPEIRHAHAHRLAALSDSRLLPLAPLA
ncbi:DUF1330 domain-containing protein [Actibacterium sp. MT2.3-13A]|uniref:DUF1330 domain-containing protein n=1 Tax=Actibacterium sp. MT2.3-13A TaxID=2828332 RepID=UPI001BA8546C|nr:DUF1330 domain-containing protein [Actibacterium sp. MT2.3-13A]